MSTSRIKESVAKIFEFWCEISPGNGHNGVGNIVESFPESYKDIEILNCLPHFAFPCELEKRNVEVYSFILTDSQSKWRFGFCRHDPNCAKAMIILSDLPWHDIFIKYLNQLAEIKKKSYQEFKLFLTETYNKGVPDPGSFVKIPYSNGTSVFTFSKAMHFQLPNILTSHNLSVYYSVAEPKMMIAIFAAMLAERRIIFKSNSLSKVSACIQAAHAFLYPMMWQHIFIPVLPMNMKEYLSAPMPFLIGVPEKVMDTVDTHILGEVVVFDCDRKLYTSPFDDVKNMPTDLVSQLKKQLGSTEEHRDDKFSKIFLGILVQLIGGYRDALKYTQGERITWDRDAFLESRPQHLRNYLRDILDLQIFQQFIEERLDLLNTGDGISDEFEIETVRFAERMERKKPYKEFFRNVKDKTNPAMKSAVKSVKEGGRGMKTAYKDFKLKLRESPPKSNFSNHNSNFHVPHQRNHSAPSSPVAGRRVQSELTYRQPPTETNRTINEFYNSMSSTNIKNNNQYRIEKSPPLSPPHSHSSSEMNLLQEIQQHALFQPSGVNQTHQKHPKPQQNTSTPGSKYESKNWSSHLARPDEFSTVAPVGSGGTGGSGGSSGGVLPLSRSTTLGTINMNKTRHTTTALSTKQPPPLYKRASPIIGEGTGGASGSIYFNNSHFNSNHFDAPPSTRSPPIPPPRTNNNYLSRNKFLSPTNTTTTTARQSSSSSSPISSSSPPSSSSVVNNVVTEDDDDTDIDLIKLESSGTSFDLEDFDPLNQNAKPFPPISTTPMTTATQLKTQSLNPLSFNNPLYPYYTPQNTSTSNSSKSSEDENALLRKYGLDKFTITTDNKGTTQMASTVNKHTTTTTGGINHSKGTVNNNRTENKNDWIQFD